MKARHRIKFLIAALLALALVCPVFAQAAPDPIRIATGARPLGMGKAYVGLADDAGSIFLNPAGLANPIRWQVTSMSGKLLDEFNYVSLSGLYPTNYGNLGIAYVGSSISGALPTTVDATSSPDDPIYVVDTSQQEMSYYNNLFILSYGSKLDRLMDLGFMKAVDQRLPGLRNINFGANLKLYSVNLTGDHITGGNASGQELDVGAQGQFNKWLSLGGTVQNALPMAWGGKLHYDAGWDESYPAVVKLGLAADVLGPNAIRTIGGHKLKVLADVDYEPTRANTVPPIFHLGAEWKPIDLIAIRAGLDQEMAGANTTVSNLTSGIGLYYGDFRFDYAYHQFAGAPGVDNHFFSLSYGIAPLVEPKEKIVATPDMLITTQMVTTVKGTAVDTRITQIRVNGIKLSLSARGEFQTDVSLKVGKNTIMVDGVDSQGKPVASLKLRVLRLITYPDVTKDYWAQEQIGYVGTLGIIQGYPDGSFKPEGNITRAELSTLLIRTAASGDANVPAAIGLLFPDVPLQHWAAKYINLAANRGIVKGYPDGKFKPAANITRAEGLSMIARFGGVKEIAYAGNEFSDVKASHWASPVIAGAFREGMLLHFKSQPFEPNKKLDRAESVELLYRSAPVVNLVNDLKNFDKGY